MKKTSFKSLYKGRIIEVASYDVEYTHDGKTGTYTAEIARRSPGVRLLIVDEKNRNILLAKEQRLEATNGWDYRLPGGKVFDRLGDYLPYADDENTLLDYAEKAADKECREETGLKIEDKKFLHKSVSGATIIWDLYYFLVTGFSAASQNLENGEHIFPDWYSMEAVRNMCLNGSIQEDRSVAVILRYLSGASFK